MSKEKKRDQKWFRIGIMQVKTMLENNQFKMSNLLTRIIVTIGLYIPTTQFRI